MKNELKIYLGDGLYVEQIDTIGTVRLSAPRPGGDHEVFLDPSTMANFLAWILAAGIVTKWPNHVS